MISKQRKLPPSPRNHWLWGNNDVLQDPLEFMRKMTREHGGVVNLRLLTRSAWMVTDPAVIEQILITQARQFRKHFAVRLLPIALGNGLLTSEGDFYARQRRLTQPAFQRAQLSNYYTTFVSQTQRMLDEWRDRDQRDILLEMHALTLNIASKTLFGADAENHAERVRGALRVGQTEFARRLITLFRLPMWVPTPANLRLRKAAHDLDSIIYEFIRERRASHEQHNDLLAQLLNACDEGESTGMTDKQLRDECLTIFLAGQETSALVLTWCWYLLSKHPRAAGRIYDEVDSVLQGRVPTIEDLPNLKFTEYALLETMRLYPPIHVIGREALVDTEIGGFHCQRGTTLLMPAWAVHRDEQYYPKPDAFQIQRWRNDFEKQLPKGAYFPFSLGPRACPGINFAMMQLKVIVALIAQRFQFTLLPRDRKVAANPQVTLQPHEGIPSRITCR
jgi:cytochrome P450